MSETPAPCATRDAVFGQLSRDDELLGSIRLVAAHISELERLRVRRIGELARRGVFADLGITVGEGVAQMFGWDPAPARRLARVAEHVCDRVALDGQPLQPVLPAVAEAFHAGGLDYDRVEVIVAEMSGAAAGRISPERLAEAEQQIVSYAVTTRCTAGELRRWIRQLIAMLDDDGPEPDEKDQPNELRLSRKADGTGGRISGELNTLNFTALQTAIDALAKPSPEDTRTIGQRHADALGEIATFALRHDDDLPHTGGERPQVHVVISLQELERRARATLLDLGDRITPAELRRLACDCFAVPHVLGGEGQPLDIGRSSRTIPTGMRRAVTVRDRGCAFPGCHRKPAWCECHHIIPWWAGGETKIGNIVMLCTRHHHVIHQSDWQVQIKNGLPEFIPPPWVDPTQTPREPSKFVMLV